MTTNATMTGDSLTVLTSHYALLEDAMTTQLGPMAGRIVRRLGERGSLTLKEISQTLLDEPFLSATTALEAARATPSNLTVSETADASSTAVSATAAKSVGGGSAGSSNNSMEPSALVDVAIKEVMTRLILHRVVAPTKYQATYELLLGYGLFLHVFHPLIAQCARQRYGEAGEALVLVVRQLAVVPLDSAVDLTSQRCPSMATEMPRAAQRLQADGWFERVDTHTIGERKAAESAEAASATTAASTTLDPKRKRYREEDAQNFLNNNSNNAVLGRSDPVRLCIPVLVRALLRDALEQWVAEHFPDSGLSVALVSLLYSAMFTAADETDCTNRLIMSGEGATIANAYGFPPVSLSTHSCPMTPTAVCHALAESHDPRLAVFQHVPRDDVVAALQRLATPTSSNGGLEGPLVRSSGDGDSMSRDGIEHFSLSLSAIVSALQWDCCERTVFSRHGVLGVRIIKLLLRHHMLADHTLAEETVATQPRTRQALNAMMRDGYVYQQEIPRGAITGDRQPKNSIFLWCSTFRQALLPSVREQLASALLQATSKLRAVVYEGSHNSSSHSSVDSGALALDDAIAMWEWARAPGQMQGVVKDTTGDGSMADLRERAEILRRAVRDQRNAVGLMSSAMSLMRMLLVMDYYS